MKKIRINKLKNCLILQNKAKNRIPGFSQLLSKRPDMFSLNIWPAYYKKAHGVNIWDLDNNKYIDMSISGIGANVLGYCDPDVDKAVKKVVKRGNFSSLNCPEEVELAELLCELHPWADMVRYSKTGGEAMAIAVRIARTYTGRDKVAFCGYHGWHDWYLAANLKKNTALNEHLLTGLNPNGVPKSLIDTAFPFTYNNLDEFNKVIKDHGKNLAAIIMEPIRNIYPDKGFIERVKQASKQTGAVLIIDEISSGFRLNTGGAHLKFFPKSCMPDIAVFSKALGNGYPISAIIGKKKIMEVVQDTFISSTYWTERIGPAAAIAMIKKHKKENVGKHLVEMGKKIQDAWKFYSQKYNIEIEVSGIEPLSHFNFKHKKKLELKALFIQYMLTKNILASNLYYPMFAHKDSHIKKYIKALDYSFSKIKEAIDKKTIEKELLGKPSTEGFKRLN